MRGRAPAWMRRYVPEPQDLVVVSVLDKANESKQAQKAECLEPPVVIRRTEDRQDRNEESAQGCSVDGKPRTEIAETATGRQRA